jgi:hypothetical protein
MTIRMGCGYCAHYDMLAYVCYNIMVYNISVIVKIRLCNVYPAHPMKHNDVI